ncbi:MAG TPA: ATP-binding protein [Candidatus Polarisedimenticolaceae bacterium]|nr:ATP-binding protein [Candidatus Polarisedimenticolaceae bacterium]
MTLRARLVLALGSAALLPTAVTVGVPLLRAGARAGEQVEARLAASSRQAARVLARERAALAAAVDRAALDSTLAGAAIPPSPVEDAGAPGPTAFASSAPLRELAARHRLDLLEVVDAQGRVLATTRPVVHRGDRSPFNPVLSGGAPVMAVPNLAGAAPLPALLAWHPAPVAARPASIVGARRLGREILSELADTSGQPVWLLDGGTFLLGVPDAPVPQDWRARDLAISDRFRLRVWAPPGDVAQVRRELLVAFAGVAPLALGCALLVGVLLAEGVARPIRALAHRADVISAQKTGPTPFARARGEARDEVTRLSRSFERMLDALSDSEERRVSAERVAAWQEVARRIAHEVKNPLTPIQLAVENLRRTREKAPADLDRALDEETAAILEEVGSLRSLVDEFSAFARLPEVRPVPTDLAPVVRQAVGLLAPTLEAAGIRAEVHDAGIPRDVLADPEQIGRAVKNVLLNAVEAMEGVANPALSIALQEQGGFLEIAVRDRGPGIPLDVRTHVFTPYFTTRGARGGTGLGMAIVHRIVAEHGGEVRLGDAPGGGAEVVLRLPVRGPAQA